MKKISRTFRIPADLVERFDRAADVMNIDRTEVVVKAIRKFVESVEAGQIWGTEKPVSVDSITAPELGECDVFRGVLMTEEGEPLYKLKTDIRVLDFERTSWEGDKRVGYDIFQQATAYLDFKERKCRIEYKVRWVDGVVESRDVEFPIAWKETESEIDIRLHVFPAKDKQ